MENFSFSGFIIHPKKVLDKVTIAVSIMSLNQSMVRPRWRLFAHEGHV